VDVLPGGGLDGDPTDDVGQAKVPEDFLRRYHKLEIEPSQARTTHLYTIYIHQFQYSDFHRDGVF
jgi:hypothetical protein